MKRKLTVTITRIRRQMVAGPTNFLRTLCPDCGREVELVSAAQAAAALEITEVALAALSDAGQVHALETVSGQLRFCKDSLFIGGQAANG